MGFLCFTPDQDHLTVPVNIFETQAQQSIQPNAGVIKHLKSGKPEPSRRYLAPLVSRAFLPNKTGEPVACPLDGVSIDCLAGVDEKRSWHLLNSERYSSPELVRRRPDQA